MRCPSPEPGRSRGSVTAEFALALPSLVVVLAVVVSVANVVLAQVRCVDAARAAARVAARGESSEQVVATARSLAPSDSAVSLRQAGSMVAVRVEAAVRLPLPGSDAVTISGEATADLESPAHGAAGGPDAGQVRP